MKNLLLFLSFQVPASSTVSCYCSSRTDVDELASATVQVDLRFRFNTGSYVTKSISNLRWAFVFCSTFCSASFRRFLSLSNSIFNVSEVFS